MPSDRYYGFEDLALLCEHVIASLFAISPTQQQPQLDASKPASKDAAPQLGEFIAYALYRTRLPMSITHQALLLLTRLKQRYPSARGTSTSPHRLFLSSLMLSSKISMDDTYSNKSWQVVGQGLFELREVNQMERELFAFLGWNVVVRDEELEAWVQEVVAPYEAERELSRSLAAAAAAQQHQQRKSMEDRKRRRDSRMPTPSPSTSRSPSPNTLRHRRASDAAVALLRGNPAMSSSSSLSSLNDSSACSSRQSRRRSRIESRASSPYSRSSSRAPSTVCSSYASSPSFGHGHGINTPASPCTPAGPLTPEHQPVKMEWPQLSAAKLEEALAAQQQQEPGVVDPSFVHQVGTVDPNAPHPGVEAW